MKIIYKEKCLKIVLYVAAVVLFFWWGATHIFFKKFYFNDVFGVAFNAGDDFDKEASEMIGVLCIALAYGAFLSARNPSKNANLIKVLVIAAVGGGLVFLWNILTGSAPASLLFNVALLFVMVVAIMLLYSKNEIK